MESTITFDPWRVGCADIADRPVMAAVVAGAARDRRPAAQASNEMAPSGAPAVAVHRPRNAGTAAAMQEETGHRPQGSDEAPPLREAELSRLAPRRSANPSGQSDRPTSSRVLPDEPPARPATVAYLRRPIPAPRTCQWIAGRPTPDDSCKCGAPSVAGHAYCGAHMLRAYRILPRGVVA